MIQAYYSIANSINAQQNKIDIISGNIANVDTVAYKSSDVDFKELMYSEYDKQNTDLNGSVYMVGNGVRTTDPKKNFTQGTLVETDNDFDIALEGDGFFVLSDGSDSDEKYCSRGGSFGISTEAEGNYIVDGNGYYLLDENMEKILVPDHYESMTINSDGEIVIDAEKIAKINIVKVNNLNMLQGVENGLYIHAEGINDTTCSDFTGKAKQSNVESSNVDLIYEMTNLIKSQRLFQMNSKLIQSIDGMEAMANNLRR